MSHMKPMQTTNRNGSEGGKVAGFVAQGRLLSL